MNTVVLNVLLYMAAGQAMVTLTSDFLSSCLTKEPFPHSHPKYELHYIEQGACVLQTEKTQIECPQGRLLLLPPHYLHRIIPKDDQTRTLAFSFSIQPPDSHDPVLAALRALAPSLITDEFEGGLRLHRVREELAHRRPAYVEKIRGELTALLADLARVHSDAVNGTPALQEENRAEQIETYLLENCFNPACSCAALAAEMHLSTRQVHRLCLLYFDTSFRQLLCRSRMEIAAYRLQTTDMSVTELAQLLGYASTASFSAAYKRFFGQCPTKERT